MMVGEVADDGWRKIADDPSAPKTGQCLLANEAKTMAWESYQGVSYQPLHDTPPVWWKPGRADEVMI